MGRVLLVLLVLSGGLALAVHQAWIRIPPNVLPWKEIELDAPPGWLARFQINSLSASGPICRATLDRSKLVYTTVEERPVANGCGLTTGVQIERSQIPYNRVFEARCAVVAALYWYERELDALAQLHLGMKIARIDQWGTYACRNINARREGRRSQHATANAIDIGGFVLADGSTVEVLRDWGTDSAKGRFLKAARDSACRFFNAVLSPAYNRAHANHFHLDLGRARICR